MARISVMATVLALAVLGAPVASSQTIDARNPEAIRDMMQDLGFRAKLGTDSGGDPRITSSLERKRFSIYFYGCTENLDCTSIQFSSGFDFQAPMKYVKANEWNRKKRFARLYLDDEGDGFLEYDVNLDQGVTAENLADTIELWAKVMTQFMRFVDW